MPEQDNREINPGVYKKPSKAAVLFFGPTLGALCGGLAYGAAYFPEGQIAAEQIGLGVGEVTALIAVGMSLASSSIDVAQDYSEEGRTFRSRAKLLQAITEGLCGLGAAGALTANKVGGDITTTMIGGVVGAALGGLSVGLHYSEQTRPYPNFILPPGNSTQLAQDLPRKYRIKSMPAVFRSGSIQDFQQFRETNKEVILKWARTELPRKSNNPESLQTNRLVTSAAIIENIQHYPELDPHNEDTNLLDTGGKGGNINAHPLDHAFMFWPYQTHFEDMQAGNRIYNPQKWNSWKDRPWKHNIVLLAQYQAPRNIKTLMGNQPDLGDITDNYWLIDIIAEKTGIREIVKEE